MLISIITPSLNRADFIADAIESVRRQDHADVEHIVMDGGSTDGTLEILARYSHLIARSQADDGLYDALNKGLPLSHGEMVGFLNTDDLYEPDVFGAVARAIAENPEVNAVVGGASISKDGSTLIDFPPVALGELLPRATVGAPVFNAWFFRRSLLDELGGFDLRYRYTADRDLLIRMAFRGAAYASVDQLVYRYQMHPGSITLSGEESGEADYMFEMRGLAESYLRSGALNRHQRALFKAWHSQIVMEQILTAVHAGGWHRAARYALTGLRRRPAFLRDLTTEFVRRLRSRQAPRQEA